MTPALFMLAALIMIAPHLPRRTGMLAGVMYTLSAVVAFIWGFI